MSASSSLPAGRPASHGVISLAVAFLVGVGLFTLFGAPASDAVFSALVLAVFVALTRSATRWRR